MEEARVEEIAEATARRVLGSAMAAALADPDLGREAVSELGPGTPETEAAALRSSSKALAGYVLRWLELEGRS